MLRLSICLPLVALTAALALSAWTEPAVAVDGARYDAEGRLLRPENYREWVYVGAPVTPNALNGGKAAFPEFHSVYIHPEAYRAWQKTGTFPDGTILVKELVSVGSTAAVSGKGYFMGEFLGLEATVKDTRRFAEEPNGWAYFSFGKQPTLAAAADKFATDTCAGCHQAAAADDLVFTQYYPVLRAAKAAHR